MATQSELDAVELTPGETGATGATGSTGSSGSDGSTGAKGPRGERGRDGDDFNGDARLVSLEAGFAGLYDYRPDIGANTLGIVGVTAINSIRYPDRNGVYLGVGTGYYRGQSSIAIGVSKRSDNVSINFNVSSTGVVGAGVVWRFGN
jgi:autotransporter adhesin